MKEVYKEKITNDTAWYADDIRNDVGAWLHPLTQEQKNEVLAALKAVKERCCTVESMEKEFFPLSGFSSIFKQVSESLNNTYGFSVIRGVPIEQLDIKEIELVFSGITSHFGRKLNVDNKGTLIDHIYDYGADYSDISVRGNTTNSALTMHCDTGDVLVLFCVRDAKEGGVSNIASSMSVFNEILEKHPEYLEALFKGFHFNIRGNGPKGDFFNITKHRVPIYSYYKDKLSCRYNERAILTAEQWPGVEPLTDLEKEAVKCVAEIAMQDDLRFDVMLEPGDIAFIFNHTVFHNRSSFIDHPEPEKMRLLLRQWINLTDVREIEALFAEHYNTGPNNGPVIHFCKDEELVY